jgi:predicted DNA-binding transcriptional regulator YafY
MNSAQDILKRWMDIDRALGKLEGLHVPSFAEEWDVSTRTIYRDLEVFQSLGHPAVCELDADGRRHVWFYEIKAGALFTCNVPYEVWRKAISHLRAQRAQAAKDRRGNSR